MSSPLKQPIVLAPKPEFRIWGGRHLCDWLGRELPPGPHGESWEIYGALPVTEGPWRGRTLDSLVKEFGRDLLGERADATERSFPLLTKWLDCRDWLSVQVHPDDALAQTLTCDPQQRGKSEAWYVAKAEPEARLIHGLAPGVCPHSVLGADGAEVLAFLGYQSPTEGTLLYTGAGTVHALGPGYLIYEIQQSSDLTYRLYDWGRDRPIHREESRRCVLEARSPQAEITSRSLRCPYFEITLRKEQGCVLVDHRSFTVLACVQGEWEFAGEFGQRRLGYGDSVLLPAALGGIDVRGQGRLLQIRLGETLNHA